MMTDKREPFIRFGAGSSGGVVYGCDIPGDVAIDQNAHDITISNCRFYGGGIRSSGSSVVATSVGFAHRQGTAFTFHAKGSTICVGTGALAVVGNFRVDVAPRATGPRQSRK